jgi:hypothetical protein
MAPVRFHLQTTGAWHAPGWPGSKLRGGFGTALRRLHCTTGLSECEGCAERLKCQYSTIFETPVAADRFPLLRKYPNAPHPYSLRVPHDLGEQLEPGQRFSFDIVLFGFAIEGVMGVAESIHRMGIDGSYGGPFRIERLSSPLTGETLWPGASLPSTIPLWRPTVLRGRVSRARLEFRYPLRLKTDGQWNTAPSFEEIVRGLLRRTYLIARLYGGAEEEFAVLHPWIELARAARVRNCGWQKADWQRFSTRAEQHQPLTGATGFVEVEGELDELVPFLDAGQYVMAGSGTGMGCGAYLLTVASESSKSRWHLPTTL